jgi:cellulose synthase/poly-beta-1,6-N-acetylglucosamine synthase-like glycosyltransferase
MLAVWTTIAVVALIGWIVAGYPLAVFALARIRPGPAVRKDAIVPRVTAVVAVRNGEAWLSAKLDSLLQQRYPREAFAVLVVSDGSTDRTAEIVRRYADEDPRVRLVEVARGGKAAALNAAFAHAEGDVLLLTDVRQPLDPECVRAIVAAFADPSVGAVSGELRIRAEDGGAAAVSSYWKFETKLRHALGRVDSMLGVTGPIYAIRRALVRPLPPGLILDDMYLPLGAFFDGYRLVGEPLAIAWDEPMDVRTEFGRKVRTLAGNYQLLRHEPRLLSPRRNRMLWHYASYKLGRLLLPHLFIVLFVATMFLPSVLRWPLLAAQGTAYALALVNPLVPQRSVLKRLSAPVYAVVVMIAAAFVAQKIFFVRAESLWVPTRSS